MNLHSNRTSLLGVIGLGYVGLPLAVEFARSGYRTLGFDLSDRVVDGINAGTSHIQDIGSERVNAYVGEGLLSATTDLSRLAECLDQTPYSRPHLVEPIVAAVTQVQDNGFFPYVR